MVGIHHHQRMPVPPQLLTGSSRFPVEERPPPEPPSLCPVQKPLPGLDAMVANITDGVCPHGTLSQLRHPSVPWKLCPDDRRAFAANGKLYVTPEGTYFRITCIHHRVGLPSIGHSTESSIGACMNKCSTTPGCKRSPLLSLDPSGPVC